MQIRKKLLNLSLISILSIIFILIIPVLVSAQSDSINEGVNWLLINQNSDGSWSEEPYKFLDTYTTLESLLFLNISNAQVSQAINWVSGQYPDNTDDLTHKALLLSLAGEDTSSELSTLLTFQSSDFGWGTDQDFSSDVLDTALALQVLKTVNYSDLDTISSALFYLTNNQNADGGFGFYPDDNSNVYITSLVLKVLVSYSDTFLLDSAIDNATAYLLSKQNPDGAISSDTSTVYETSLAFDALIASDTDPSAGSGQALQNATDYLINNQLLNGSWNDDPYSTALALRALAQVKPNLTLTSNDITFSDPSPTVGDTITVSATVHNTGLLQAPSTGSGSILVRFYDGHPASGGVLIEETTISAIPAFGSAQAGIIWTIPSATTQAIYVFIDPLNSIDEQNETDNSAYKNLTSATLPDLNIVLSEIAFNPFFPAPGQLVEITAEIRNHGETGADNVTVDIYDGDPSAGGTLIRNETVTYIVPGVSAMVQFTDSFTAGSHRIYAIVDKDSLITESNESNNTAIKTLHVGAILQDIDLSIIYPDISFNPAFPVEGDLVTINAIIHNEGMTEAVNVPVNFYRGEQFVGGDQIGSTITVPSVPARSSVTVSTVWDSTGYAGSNLIYVWIDPQDTIPEQNKSNNIATKTILVAGSSGPDLKITASDMSYTPLIPLTGEIVTVTANIRNIGTSDANDVLVQFSSADSDISQLIIGSETIPLIAQGSTVSVQTTWNTSGFAGNYELYVNIDPNGEIIEMNEINNTAHKPIEITVPQGPDLTITEISTTNLITDLQTLQITGSIDVTLENAGNQDTVSSFDLTVFEDTNGNEILDTGIDNILGQAVYPADLVSEATDIISIALTGDILFRDNLIYVLADSNNAVEELDETNNMRNTGQECEYIPFAGSFNPVEKWAWTGSDILPQYKQVMIEPIVANLTDDNNDGLINEDDMPDIIFTSGTGVFFGDGVLRVLNGADGTEIFTVTDPEYRLRTDTSISAGDIDGDGIVEILAVRSGTLGGGLMAFEHDGTFKWLSAYGGWLSGPSIADIDNDGKPDIILGSYFYTPLTALNNDGTLKWRSNAKVVSYHPHVADLDLDGTPEIIAENIVYRNNGTSKFGYYDYGGDDAIANFDDDPYPEIVFVGNTGWGSDKVRLIEHTGAIKWEVEGRGGPPTVADFDGDGMPEIGTADRYSYTVYDTDGSILWKRVLPGIIGWHPGSSAFDFDGDGISEVLYNHEQYLFIFRGTDGAILFQTPNSNLTNNKSGYYPIVADIDKDNRAEIIVASNDVYAPSLINGVGFHGVRVFEDANDNWVDTREIWNQHTYHITNINDDGTIPTIEQNSWDIYNNYRSNSLPSEEATRSSDLTVSYLSVDQSSYPASVSISARIGNGGALSHPAGAVISFYDGDPGQGGTLIGTANTSETIEKGNYEDISLVWSSPAEGEHNIYVIADEANTFNECREDNNTAFATVNLGAGVQPPVDKPDLEISPSDITIIPPDTIEGQLAVISAIIHNIGTLGASDVIVSFYDGDPQNNGGIIGSVTKSYIDAGANTLAEITWDTFGQTGINYIHVVIDPEDLIEELNENNNSSLIQVDVTTPQKPDLAVTSSDIVFSNLNPEEGQPLTVSAAIHNFGTETPSAGSGFITVELYDGDPSSGGIPLSQKTISQIIRFGGEITLDFDIDTIGFTGSHDLYISIDPDNIIDEISETNNIAWNSLTIGESGINLSILTDKTTYTANEAVQITVNIENLINANRSGTLDVKILDLNDNVVSTVTGSQTLDFGPDESKVLNYIWNTDATLYGNYKVYSHFIEDGNVIARADTPITISPVKEISSKIFTDKISYPANQTVTISSQITSTSPNYIFVNLQAEVSIVNNLGETLYTESNVIPILVPNQLVEFNSYWNTSTNPKGIYTVNLEVIEGVTVLGTSTATFEILGTSDTGEGLTGTITASPDPVYQGQYETLTYTITNYGNEDITNLKVTVIIVDPDTQEAKNTLETTIDLPMNTTITGNLISSTLNLSPRIHLAVLQVSSDTITEPKTLDSTTFEVKPGMEITKTIPDVTNLLVWVNDKCEEHECDKHNECDKDDQGRLRLDLLKQILGEAVTDYYIVYDKKDFQAELRNPYYTDFLILGDHNPIEDHFAEELREQVYSGKGLISSLWLKHGEHHGEDYDPLFGIKFKGYLSGDEHEVELIDSPVSEAGTLDAKGKAVKVEAEEGTTIAGWITPVPYGTGQAHAPYGTGQAHAPYGTGQGTCCHKNEDGKYPAIVINEYGEGKAIYYAFDLGLTLNNDENYSQLSNLINNSVAYAHKPIDTTAFYPYQLIPVEITIKSLGGAFDLRITETYPAEIRLYDPSTLLGTGPSARQWITENPWVTDIHLEPDEIRTILYYALAPDSAGTYMLQTEIGYLEEETYNFYQNLSLDITVDRNARDMAGDIISALNSLSVSKKDSGKRDNAVIYINNVQNRTINSEKDIEENIKDIRKAINSLLSIASADTSDVRLIMDEFLKIWESRYYFQLY